MERLEQRPGETGDGSARGLVEYALIGLVDRALDDDAGALALANAGELQRITWLELAAPRVGEAGREALRRRFGHRVGVFAGASLHAFSSLGRRF